MNQYLSKQLTNYNQVALQPLSHFMLSYQLSRDIRRYLNSPSSSSFKNNLRRMYRTGEDAVRVIYHFIHSQTRDVLAQTYISST
jgi:hypothetical protein